MLKKLISSILLFCALGIVYNVNAQEGTENSYSPYSTFGVGTIFKQGTPYNRSMGGVGIANRNNRFINYINPAAITARDTLTFMMDFGLVFENKVMQQKPNLLSANNNLDIYNICFTVPLYKRSAFVLGMVPYSSVAYDLSYSISNQNVIALSGDVYYKSRGRGGLYTLFMGPAVTFWDNLSVGAQLLYTFGSISKKSSLNFSNPSYIGFDNNYKMLLGGVGAKLGLQYEFKFNVMSSMILGLTYTTRTRLKGNIKISNESRIDNIKNQIGNSPITNTLWSKNGSKPCLADELGLGISYKKGDNLRFEFDYLFSNWTHTNLLSVDGLANKNSLNITPSYGQSIRGGFEYMPNKNDVRYYLNRCSYRGGLYFDQSYMRISNEPVNEYGLTLGITFPISRGYNGISFGFNFGQIGSKKNYLIRETYAIFTLGINISEIWFVKPKYE